MKRAKFLMLFLAVCGMTAVVLGLYLIKTDANMVQVQAQVAPSPTPSPSPSPSPTPLSQGCTPGFWKNNAAKKGASLWIGFTPGELLSAAGFNTPASFSDGTTLADVTLLQALSLQGGSTLEGAAETLLRAAVAAILNASQFGGSASSVIAEVNAALASNDRTTILDLVSTLDAAN